MPSSVDEATFRRVFGGCQWAVMFIVAEGDKSYARLRFSVGPGGQVVIPVEVDYSKPFGPSDQDAWEAEYKASIKLGDWDGYFGCQADSGLAEELWGSPCPNYWLEELEAMDPTQRRFNLDELAARSDPWDEESEVFQ